MRLPLGRERAAGGAERGGDMSAGAADRPRPPGGAKRRRVLDPIGRPLKDTMVRAGQSSGKAAMIYQHSDHDRQQAVAACLGSMVRAKRAKHHKDGRPHHTQESSAG
ncbi:hypothetical protein ACFV2H_11070 [Streptomyces sp. NPDC059629]|uniref:hypothetical protein n=1 Tax=Streptomyces sp. NPDC059629 TaxID=3346889 RepID=UPI0036A4715B